MSTILGITGVFALILGLFGWNVWSLKKEEKRLIDSVEYWRNCWNRKNDILASYEERTPMRKLIDALDAMNATYEVRDYGDSQGVLVTDRKKPVLFTFDSEGEYKA